MSIISLYDSLFVTNTPIPLAQIFILEPDAKALCNLITATIHTAKISTLFIAAIDELSESTANVVRTLATIGTIVRSVFARKDATSLTVVSCLIGDTQYASLIFGNLVGSIARLLKVFFIL